MSRKLFCTLAVSVIGVLASSGNAHAFQTTNCHKCCIFTGCTDTTVSWPGSSTTLQVHTGLGSGATSCTLNAGTTFLNDMFCAAKGWFDVFSSAWFFNINGNQSFSSAPSGDGINQVAFVGAGNFAPGLVALTAFQFDCVCGWSVKITETDILFNASTSWFIGLPTPWTLNGASNISFRQVAMHEMGHALGLSLYVHQDGFPDLMNTNYPFGGWAQGAPGFGSMNPHADDRAGDVSLYPNGGNDLQDVEVLPYTWDGTNNVAAQALPGQVNPGNFNDATSNCARPGDTVVVRLTLGNLRNASFSNIRIGFYLSNDAVITTSDTLIATTTWSPASYGRLTQAYNVWIPNWVSLGTYSFGVILDDTDVVTGEVNDLNNATDFVNQMEVKSSCP